MAQAEDKGEGWVFRVAPADNTVELMLMLMLMQASKNIYCVNISTTQQLSVGFHRRICQAVKRLCAAHGSWSLQLLQLLPFGNGNYNGNIPKAICMAWW